MMKTTFTLTASALLFTAASSVYASVLVEDGFDGLAGTAPEAAKFEWGGEVTQNGTGQLSLQTWSVSHSWLLSKAGGAAIDGGPLVLQLRAYAYAENGTPGVYGDQQPRGLRVGVDPNNVVEFYSLSRTNVGMRVRKDGIESSTSLEISSGVDAMHDYEISVSPTAVVFKVDGVLAGTLNDNIPTGVLNIYVSTDDGGSGNVPVSIESLSLSTTEALQFQFYTNSVDGTITLERYIGPGGAVTLPSEINGRSVTAVGPNAFYSCTTLTSVAIPNSITSIGDTAFVNCTSLAAAAIGSGVTNIGYHAFFNCSSLSAITVDPTNASFSSVDGILFDKTQSRLLLCPPQRSGQYVIPSTVATVGYGAFDHCVNLKSVIIPDSVTNIEAGVFYACAGLTNVAIGNGVEFIGTVAFYSCTSLTNVAIPDSVTSIGSAFSDCSSLVSVSLGKNITNINGAFVRCANLASIVVPDSVTDVGDMAFAGCTRLAEVTLPSGVTRLGDGAFSDCRSLTALVLPDSLTDIGQYAFDYCTSLADLKLPNQLTRIRQYAFKDCTSLANLGIPDSVTSIGWAAFSHCVGLTNISIGKGVTSIESWAFTRCSNLKTISVDELNSSFSSVDDVLFDKNQTVLLKFPEGKSGSYLIPGTVTSIADNAFQDNAGLTSLTLPGSLTSIGIQAFASCPNLASLYFQGNAPTVASYAFNGDNQATVYYLPETTGWGEAFGGRSAVLWNPRAVTNDGRFGVQGNQFGFTITGSTGLVVVVEACADLLHPSWSPVATNTLTDGSSLFSDAEWTNYPARVYRLRSP